MLIICLSLSLFLPLSLLCACDRFTERKPDKVIALPSKHKLADEQPFGYVGQDLATHPPFSPR